MTTISDRLVRARHRDFVGREAEQAAFRQALAEEELPFLVLDVYGPGGVGKTALLWRFHALAGERGSPCFHLDGEEIEPTPAAFREALAERGFGDDLPTAVPVVLLVDGFEGLAVLDPWLRGTFLPQLPVNVLTVRASSMPPAPAWRSEPGWSALHRRMPLRNLSPEESRDFLLRKGVPEEHHEALLQFCHGHPLAMTLVAELLLQHPETEFRPESAPNVVGPLLDRILGRCPGPRHREALEACSLVRVATLPLLQAMLGDGEVHDLFEELRTLSFMQVRARGLQLHDLARGALEADLRWRNPDRHRALLDRARRFYSERLREPDPDARLLHDYLYVHRSHPLVGPLAGDEEASGLEVDRARPEEGAALEEMARRHEGPQASRWLAGWWRSQPEAFLAVRDPRGDLRGFLAALALEGLDPEAVDDPAVASALDHLRTLRPGEKARMVRFWMAAGTHQGPSSVQSRLFVEVLRQGLGTPGLAFTLFATSEAARWGDLLALADFAPLPALDFTSDGRRHGVFGHDWRALPPAAWLDLVAARWARTSSLEPRPATLVVLSREAFEEAVGRALRNYQAPELLGGNPILGSRLVASECGASSPEGDRVAALRRLLREATESLQFSRRQVKFFNAVYHTYIEPAGTQEQVSERLDVPFSTYRRHLKAGLDRVAEILWHRELSAS